MPTVFYGGEIMTLDENEPIVEAVMVQKGKIIQSGRLSQILEDAQEIQNIEFYNLQGSTMLPGFIDAHGHLSMVADFMEYAYLASPPLGEATSIDSIVRIMSEHEAVNHDAAEGWIIGYAYDHTMLEERRHPNRFDLDRVSTMKPVIILHDSLHRGVANSCALELLGIRKDTPNPPGGFIGRGTDGEPDGILEETAFNLVLTSLPQLSVKEKALLVEKAQNLYASHGITTVQDGATRSNQFDILAYAAGMKKLYLDVVSYPLDGFARTKLADPEYTPGVYNEHLKLGGGKIFLDGGIPPQTAWLSEPYFKIIGGKPEGYCGYPIHSDEDVMDFFRVCIENDWQIMAHTIGDCACGQFLRCYEGAVKLCGGKKGRRPVMLHATAIQDEQLESVRRDEILLSFFNSALYLFGDYYVDVSVGEKRAGKLIPIASASKIGIPYSLHQDAPVSPPDMLHSIWSAAVRKTRSGRCLGEPISVLEAIKGVTIAAAYQYSEENEKGSITVGKKADFVILDRNPLTVPVDDILKIKILRTIKDGICVWG